MQLLATTGHEFGEHAGLGLDRRGGQADATRPEDERVPHVGWNDVVRERESHSSLGLEPAA